MNCWIITEGLAGTENQCLGIAEALGVQPEVKRIALRQPWKALSPYLGLETGGTFNPALTPPWPDLLLAGGRKAIAAARYIKKASGGKTFTVFVQDPRINPANFDLVVAPEHDPVRGGNVVLTDASPNRITTEKLAEAKTRFPQFGALKSPRVAVLIGGDSKAHKLTPEIMQNLATQLKGLDAGLIITASRRTGEQNKALLKRSLGDSYFWDGTGENPYFAMLAWADYIVVTSDSVSMLSEAGSTGKPVYMVPLAGGSARLDRLHRNLMNNDIIRLFDGRLEHWTYTSLHDAQKAADEIKKRLKD